MNLTKQYEKTEWGNRIMFSNDDSTIRFALYTYDDDPNTLYFSNLFVDDNIRGNGLGDEILNYVFNYAKSKSYNSIILNVVKNSWVRKWYERKGFHYLEDCDGEYKGNIWMIKNIKNNMIKKFNQFIKENYIPNLTLIVEDHKFDKNPGLDFGEEWEALDKNDEVYRYIKSKLPNYEGTQSDSKKPSIYNLYKVPEHNDGAEEETGCHYVLHIYGGENGPGNWKIYADYIKNIFSNVDDAWLLDLVNDAADDVWDLRLCFRKK